MYPRHAALLTVAAVCCRAAASNDDEDLWRRMVRDLDNPLSPIHQAGGSLRQMMQLRCKQVQQGAAYPSSVPKAGVDKLCTKVLGGSTTTTGLMPVLFDLQKLVMLLGTVALVCGILWWIWNQSSPDSCADAAAAAAAPAANAARGQQQKQPAGGESRQATEQESKPVMPSEQQRAEQRAARLARFSGPAGSAQGEQF
eukprot:TRINITY_DN7358_c0_g1_i1.p1 TRINITY_DN7358_c0_g1~~TRINITY_DN7358_c0_g1_i1.p1  ORF type:complete len:198 (-),score=47.01 TRINITY_DN7358_c0_g1_i1:277-870(-)